MPDRYLREALLHSDRWNALSLDGQNLYVRLMMIVDDFGCYDGREQVIAQQAYYLGRHEALPLAALHEQGLIVRYTNAGKPYIALMRWGETLRGRRRWPAPPVCNDLPEIKYRGKYGTPLNFRNPTGTDAVSILLDLHARPVMPQPPEWRRVGTDWLPLTGAAQQEYSGPDKSQRASTSSNSAQLLPAVTSPPPPARSDSGQSVVSSQESRVIEQESASQQSAVNSAQSNSALSLQTPTATTPNGIKFKNGAWQGLSEAQRLKWQDMFAAISIPDQVDRAGAWLDAHPKEHAQIDRDNGEHAFLVRWLLREARPAAATVHTRAKTDA